MAERRERGDDGADRGESVVGVVSVLVSPFLIPVVVVSAVEGPGIAVTWASDSGVVAFSCSLGTCSPFWAVDPRVSAAVLGLLGPFLSVEKSTVGQSTYELVTRLRGFGDLGIWGSGRAGPPGEGDGNDPRKTLSRVGPANGEREASRRARLSHRGSGAMNAPAGERRSAPAGAFARDRLRGTVCAGRRNLAKAAQI